jgi:hypothetical protein
MMMGRHILARPFGAKTRVTVSGVGHQLELMVDYYLELMVASIATHGWTSIFTRTFFCR